MYSRHPILIALSAVAALTLVLGACADEKKRPVGGVCGSNGQCVSGVCGGGFCLTPEGDDDTDGLINKIEAGLGTDPVKMDTDGDGQSDAEEIGDPQNPSDTDGDGKNDAIESAIEDVDSDCIVDELDANDAFSDPPSEAQPEACGNGRPYPDPGEVAATCESVDTFLGGTCARALGVALVECFDPEGCVTVGPSPVSGKERFTWENGAYHEYDEETTSYAMYASSGTLCVEADELGEGEGGEIYSYRASGQTWTITIDDEQTADIACADGTVVQVTAAETEALGDCQGFGDVEFCSGTFPGGCVADADCETGEECCEFSGVSVCVPEGDCTL